MTIWSRKLLLGIVRGLVLLVLLNIVFASQIRAYSVRQWERRLDTMLALRWESLARYFRTLGSEVVLWSGHASIAAMMIGFDDAFGGLSDEGREVLAAERLSGADNPLIAGYADAHARFHPFLEGFRLHHGYYDVFLIDLEGNIVYTAFKESDFATNLETGPWKATGLAEAFHRALGLTRPGFVTVTDFATYPPSNNEPAAFIASLVHDEDQLLGVLAVQIPADSINEIMHFRSGMGSSGETYIVGSDFLMRSDSRFSEESTVLKTRVDGETVKLALDGHTGVQVVDDYRGIPVVSAYTPFFYEGLEWAVLAEVDESEAVERASSIYRVQMIVSVGIVLLVLAIGIVVAPVKR